MALFASIKSQKVRRRVVELVKALTEDERRGGKRAADWRKIASSRASP